MRPNILVSCRAAVPLFLGILVLYSEARPGSHKHHHNEHLPREVRSLAASSDGRLIINPTAGVCSESTTVEGFKSQGD